MSQTFNRDSSQLLAVSSPPFWHCGRTLQMAMRDQIIALMPAAIMAVIIWGLPALRVICLSVATCIAVEALCQKIMKRTIAIDNLSAVFTGILFAFLLPAAAPWWLVVLGATLSIALGKMAFGDIGASPLCIPLVGYALCFISFPTYMDPNAMQLATDFVDPLVRLKYFGVSGISDISLQSLVFGQQIGALGAAQTGALLLGAVYVCARGVTRWEIAFSFLLGVVITAAIFQLYNPEVYASPFFHLFTGSTILGAFFLATEMSSSPNRQLTMFLYGFIGGILVILIRVFGVYTDGVAFAILLINLLMPQLESIPQKPFAKPSKKQK